MKNFCETLYDFNFTGIQSNNDNDEEDDVFEIAIEDDKENLQIGETSEKRSEPTVRDTGHLPVEPTCMLVDSYFEIVIID